MRRKKPLRVEAVSPFSQTAEYALRAMACLAERQESSRAVDLTGATQVPVHYLSKVLRRLVAAGLLVSQKGHGGGFLLARRADQITLADVLDAVGEAPSGGRCAFGWGSCDARHPCPLHPAWSVLNDLLIGWAQKTTLADVARPTDARRRRG